MQSVHFLQAQGSQTFKNPLHLKAKTAEPLKNATPTSMDWNSNVHQRNAKSLGVCKLNQILSDLALAVALLRSGKRSQGNPHVSEL